MSQKILANFFLPLLFLAVFVCALPSKASELININTADQAALETLNGIGPSKAQAIITYRTQNGPFAKIEDIMNVSGIGTATFNNIKDYITVSGAVSATQTATSSTSTQTQTQPSPSAPISSWVAPPVPEVFADAGGNRTVIVGADVLFDGRAYSRQKEIITNVRFLWNFGDGAVAEGAAVLHHFEYPGRYAVVLTIAEDRSASVDQIIVLAEPANLAFFNIQNGGVRIENRAGRDLDLSRWVVRQFGRDFPLPEYSVILAGSSMFISQKTLGFWSGPSAELDYPNGVLALRAGESVGGVSAAVLPAAVVVKTPSALATPKAIAAQGQKGEALGASTTTPAPIRKGIPSPLWLSLGALAVLLAGGMGAVHYLQSDALKKETSLTVEEFDIVD